MNGATLHVALVTPWKTGGGIANYSERLRDALQEIGVTVTVVPIKHPQTWNVWEFNEVAQTIPSSADIIHIQYEAGVFGHLGVAGICTPSFYARLARRDQAVVTTLHEIQQSYPERGLVGNAILAGRDWVIERLVLAASDKVIVHTDHAVDVLCERHGDCEQIHKLRHPVDEPAATPLDRATARDEIGVRADTVLVTFGWVESKKRYEDVIRALPKLDDTTYLIAGEPRYDADEAVLDEVFALAESLGVRDSVRHLGYVPDEDLPTLFGAADLAVVPYAQVTQSGAVNTALAYGCPVLATALPAFEELAANYDCVLTYDNPNAVADRVREAVNNGAKMQLRESAKHYMNAETWASFASRTLTLYTTVVKSGTD